MSVINEVLQYPAAKYYYKEIENDLQYTYDNLIYIYNVVLLVGISLLDCSLQDICF